MSPLEPVSGSFSRSLGLGSTSRRPPGGAAAAAFALVLALAALPGAASAAVLRVGDLFPLQAGRIAAGSAAVNAGRVTLVDFWASWCAPCKASFPAYARLSAEFAARGLQVVAVSVDEDPAAFSAFVRRMQPPFATLHDAGHRLARQVAPPALPTCFLLGPDGRIRYVHTGYHDGATAADLRREIETVLAETAPTS
jgi:thiol-disulfide isomerase/thioredoxin